MVGEETTVGASEAEATSPLAPGVRVGKYELLRRLAVGGMAEIFLARSQGIEGFEKLVVLKSILPQHAVDDEFVCMFLDEARLAATLHHPNVAQVFDIGRGGGKPFFTMEYIDGRDLRQVCKAARGRGGLPLEQAVTIGLGVAAGLHYAHEKGGPDGRPLGIVHRDVSASNVIISYDGAVKIVDFGIAKAASHRQVTRTGIIKGKLACMSPEQCRGDAVDRRSDVFAIGILLYEITTGTRLYEADSDYAMLHQIIDKDAPAPSTRVPDYPPALEAIVMRALRRDREQRYATAQELQVDLENFARDSKLITSPVELGRHMEELFGRSSDRDAARESEREAATRALPLHPRTARTLPRRRWIAGAVGAMAAGGGALIVAAARLSGTPPQAAKPTASKIVEPAVSRTAAGRPAVEPVFVSPAVPIPDEASTTAPAAAPAPASLPPRALARPRPPAGSRASRARGPAVRRAAASKPPVAAAPAPRMPEPNLDALFPR